MYLQITMEVKMEDYQLPETSEAGQRLLKAFIQNDADWPEKIRMDACTGTNLGKEYELVEGCFYEQ